MENCQVKVLMTGGSEDDYKMLHYLLVMIKRKTHRLHWSKSIDHTLTEIDCQQFDIIFIHETIGDGTWFLLIDKIRKADCRAPLIVISRDWDERLEDEVIDANVADYLALNHLKPLQLYHAIHYAILRKRSNEQLAQERDVLQTLMNNIPDTIYFKDLNSCFTRINTAQAKMLGLANPKDAIGKSDFDFFEHADEAYSDEQHIIKTGQPQINKQEKIRRADGEYRYVLATKVPIRDKLGKVTGTVGITRDFTNRIKGEQELKVVKDRLQEALNNLNEELAIALKIQKSLLPTNIDQIEGIRVAEAYMPCSAIGGDLYDVVQIDDQRIGLLMFDVAGHGVPAALVATMCKALFADKIARGLSPGELLNQINRELVYHFNNKRYLAAFYGIYNKTDRSFVYGSAAHPPAILFSPDSGRIKQLTTHGIYIGLDNDSEFSEQRVEFQPGDKLLLFTDGLIEIFDPAGNFFGLKKLEQILPELRQNSVSEIVDRLLQVQRDFCQTDQHNDDITLLAIEIE